MNTNLFIFINVFTFINLLILSSILLFRKKNSITNLLLAAIIIDPGLNFLNNIIILSGLIFNLPEALFLFQGTASFYGVLIYAYTLYMIGHKFNWKHPLNFITLGIILLDIWFYIDFRLMSVEEQTRYLECLTFKECFPEPMNIINALCVSLWMAYFIQSYITIRKHSLAAKNFFSDIDKLKIKYLNTFIILVIVLNFSLALLYTIIQTSYVEFLIIPIIVNIVNLFFLYYAFSQNTIYNQAEYCNLVETTEKLDQFKKILDPLCKEIKELMENNKSQKYRLTEIEIEENYQKILNYLASQKPYLDKKINLTKFSSDIGACSHNISLTINTKFKLNFFDFINFYRVEEAKKMLENLDKNIKLEAVGYECGFNSKSSFYRAFKKFTGTSPLEYQKNLNP